MVLQRIRRTRRQERVAEPPNRFDEYRPAYEEILRAARDLAGEDALDNISDWAIEYTRREARLPPPDTFRVNTRRILKSNGVEIPPDSKLAST